MYGSLSPLSRSTPGPGSRSDCHIKHIASTCHLPKRAPKCNGQGVQFAESRECTWMLLGIPQPVGPGMSRMFVVRIACPYSMGGTMELGGCARVGLFPSVPSLTARAPLRFKPIWRNGWGCHVIGSSRLTKPESLGRCYRISAFGIPRAQFAPCPG